jgi:hypothetical protein
VIPWLVYLGRARRGRLQLRSGTTSSSVEPRCRAEQDWRNLDAELDRERVPEAPEVPGFRKIGDLRQASCLFCPYVRSRKLVRKHMDRVHRGGKPGSVCCAVCRVQTSRKSDLSLHIQRELPTKCSCLLYNIVPYFLPFVLLLFCGLNLKISLMFIILCDAIDSYIDTSSC